MCRVQIYFTVLMVAFGALASNPEDQDSSPYDTKQLISDQIEPKYAEKRAPSGFMGMRGKKLFSADYNSDSIYPKRVPMGFSAMRGKKNDEYAGNGISDKRAPVGFFGMRGKKEYDFLEEMKRAPAGFFGMRGKKQPTYGFFGSRGKKYPYELRGNFVGVRGKRFSNEVAPEIAEDEIVLDELNSLAKGLDINQLILLLTETQQNLSRD